MTPKEKCIAKWQKRYDKSKLYLDKYGKSYFNHYEEEVKIYEEIIKDLKRLAK